MGIIDKLLKRKEQESEVPIEKRIEYRKYKLARIKQEQSKKEELKQLDKEIEERSQSDFQRGLKKFGEGLKRAGMEGGRDLQRFSNRAGERIKATKKTKRKFTRLPMDKDGYIQLPVQRVGQMEQAGSRQPINLMATPNVFQAGYVPPPDNTPREWETINDENRDFGFKRTPVFSSESSQKNKLRW